MYGGGPQKRHRHGGAGGRQQQQHYGHGHGHGHGHGGRKRQHQQQQQQQQQLFYGQGPLKSFELWRREEDVRAEVEAAAAAAAAAAAEAVGNGHKRKAEEALEEPPVAAADGAGAPAASLTAAAVAEVADEPAAGADVEIQVQVEEEEEGGEEASTSAAKEGQKEADGVEAEQEAAGGSEEKKVVEDEDEDEAREEAPPRDLEREYDEYKRDYMAKLENAFFEAHAGEEWLLERYDPVRLSKRNAAMREWAVSESACFRQQLLDGDTAAFVASANLDPASMWAGESDEGEKASGAPPARNELSAKELTGHGTWSAFIRRVPAWCDAATLEAAIRGEGGDFDRLVLGDPIINRNNNFGRCAWVVFSGEEEAIEGARRLHKMRLTRPEGAGDSSQQKAEERCELQVFHHRPRAFAELDPAMSNPLRVAHDADQAKRLADALDEEREVPPESRFSQLLSSEAVAGLIAEGSPTTQLDLTCAYLRRVHFYLYFSGLQCRDEGDLLGHKMHRRSRAAPVASKGEGEEGRGAEDEAAEAEAEAEAAPSSAAVCTDAERVDAAAARRLVEASSDVTAAAAAALAEQVSRCSEIEVRAESEWLAELTTPAKDGNARCGIALCNKLFRDATFLHKHLKNKHAQVLASTLDRALRPVVKEAFMADGEKPLPTVPTKGAPARGQGPDRGRADSRSREMLMDQSLSTSRQPASAPVRHSDVQPSDPRQMVGYEDVDAPKVATPALNYGETIAFPPPKKKKRKLSSSSAAGSK